MCYIGKNLRYLREINGIEQSQIASLLGKKSTSAISEWEKGVRNPNIGDLHDLAVFFNVNLDDFVSRDLTISDIKTKTSISASFYKFFPVSVSAGALENIEGITNYEEIPVSDKLLGKYAGSKNIILLKVNGESMNKLIPNGSYIVVDTSRKQLGDIKSKDIVVFSNNCEYSVKRFINDESNKRFIFKPESTDDTYADIIVNYDNSEDLRLIGKVIKYIVDVD